MATQQSKIHRVEDGLNLRASSPEIAGAIFEVTNYDERLAESIWEQQDSDDVLLRAFEKTDKDVLLWNSNTIERKHV